MVAKAYLDELAKVPLFSSCSKKELQRISRAADEITIDAGRTFVDQDATGHEAFVIVSGEATVRRNGRKVATLGPGDPIGELALLDGGPRTATVQAVTDLTVLVIAQREFAALIDDVPAIAHKLLAALAGRVRALDKHVYP